MKIKPILLYASLSLLMLFASISLKAQNTNQQIPPIGKDGVSSQNTKMNIVGIERQFDVPTVQTPIFSAPSRVIQKSKAATYSMAQLAAMDSTTLVNTIMSISYWDLTDIYQYNQGAKDFYLNNDLMKALFNRLEKSGREFTATDMKQIPLLIEVLRAGPYLGFYYSDLAWVNSLESKSRFLPAFRAIMANPLFAWSPKHGLDAQDIPVQDQILAAVVGRGIGSGILAPDLMPKITSLLKQFNDQDLFRDPAKANVLWTYLGGVDYGLYADGYRSGKPANSQYYKTVEPFIDELARLAKYNSLCYADRNYLISSAIFWLGHNTGKFTEDKKVADILSECLALYPKNSDPWLETARTIGDGYASLVPGFDYAVIKQEIMANALPKKYSFDDGKLVFIAGENVDPDKIKMLYWATKEVKAQFLRNLATDQPINSGLRADSMLTAYVYNSPAEYKKYNTILYGLGTNNGGMYIESWGKFFTYERTIYESTYSLEDLFRHEFVHYLQGRFLCPGYFGESLYTGDRLTWIEEGSAEFNAGSSRTKGIPQRWSMVSNVNSSASSRMTLPEVVKAGYSSGFTFYTYAYVAFHFMYEKHRDVLYGLHKVVQDGNAANIDAYVKNFATTYAAEYLTYMSDVKKAQDTFDNPETSLDYYKNVSAKNHDELFNEIAVEASMTELQTSKYYSADFNTFELRGRITLGTSHGEAADRNAMDLKADAFLEQLSAKTWNGYKTLTAHFVKYVVDASNNATFEIVFKGLLPATLTGTETVKDAKAQLLQNYPNPAKGNTTIKFSTSSSSDVKLKLYTIDGKLVRVLLDRDMLSGDHSVEINVSSLANGVYYYKLDAENKSATSKMIVNN